MAMRPSASPSLHKEVKLILDFKQRGSVGRSMPRPIQERIANLRKEIAQINEENLLYVKGGSKPPGATDRY